MNANYLKTYYCQDWVYKEIKVFFSIEEFFSPQMRKAYKEAQLWGFLDFRLLSNLLFIRKNRKRRITINNWKHGGPFSQRGFRSALSRISISYYTKGRLYASAHVRASAVDFTEEKTVAEETRNWILNNSAALPYKCRLEWKKKNKLINWVHLDVDYLPENPKVYRFNV